ncbi:cytidine deaminase, homotetrameric [Halobacteroides halobius DSM 5150]|uniref:Cytidine deaminase n=1 Tax=Halobacteroides halobius (strain ATCC 35273 / DSM 5150 / MD-1) TaxID=748449 RepID=L0K8A4_HALHC|nr:cytidine deaminase [Halobacteroides halobius]AGB41512.1 cytidine deaminase, homotetrameric [Halobacteroides halobius DSM 5150]
MKEQLIEEAIRARENAYTPYSNFKVGAALLTVDDEIYTGCNVENSSYGLTNCAERTAIFKAISEGKKDFKALAVVADTDDPVSPCGACRQVISEFGPGIKVIMANLEGDAITKDLKDILWGAFAGKDMDK